MNIHSISRRPGNARRCTSQTSSADASPSCQATAPNGGFGEFTAYGQRPVERIKPDDSASYELAPNFESGEASRILDKADEVHKHLLSFDGKPQDLDKRTGSVELEHSQNKYDVGGNRADSEGNLEAMSRLDGDPLYIKSEFQEDGSFEVLAHSPEYRGADGVTALHVEQITQGMLLASPGALGDFGCLES